MRIACVNPVEFYNNGYPSIRVGTGSYQTYLYPSSNKNCYIGKSDLAFKYVYSDYLIDVSDKRLKENIREVNNALETVTNLKAFQYDFKKETSIDDSLKLPKEILDKKEKERKDRYGFMAQDVMEIYPSAVVYDDSTDIYGIDYTKFVPILVEAIKEQQLEIEDIKAQIAVNGMTEFKSDDVIEDNSSMKASLEQNVPNPFTENTIIKFFIPSEASEANIYIYDLQGKQIRDEQIDERESSELVISGSTLSPGMYHYTLIVDNKVIDTKTMILTDI
jgi:hypothetical protein